MKHDVKWVDGLRDPVSPPDPKFPDGVDLDCSRGSRKACRVDLPYPAARCGHYVIRCSDCQLLTMVSTAGRRDDPRSVKLPCKAKPYVEQKKREIARRAEHERTSFKSLDRPPGRSDRPITLAKTPWDK